MTRKSKYFNIFIRESREHLESLQGGLVGLEKRAGDRDLFRELMRNAHTLKGSARMLGFDDISAVGHRIEDLLEKVECGAAQIDGATTDLLLQAADVIDRLLTALERNEPPPVQLDSFLAAFDRGELLSDLVAPAVSEQSEGFGETVRAGVKSLDSLVNRLGELIICKRRLERRAADLKILTESVPDTDLALKLQEFRHRLDDELLELNFLVQDLQVDAMALRMLPLRSITEGFERMVRDLAREQGKVIEFEIVGDQIELDRVLLETLKPTLVHLLRNAVDHGIELLEERLINGKSPKGEIRIEARHDGNRVVISVSDNGRGIDPQFVKQAAVARGLITEEHSRTLSDADALYLVLEPGFSTREIVTDISGRGVGMDVVKKNIEKLKGDLSIKSRMGSFAEFELRLPFTLAVMEVLLVECGGEVLAIPVSYVHETVKITQEDIDMMGGREVITISGVPASLIDMREALGFPARQSAIKVGKLTVVVLTCLGQYVACVVDRLISGGDIVVKNLSEQFRNATLVSGATILEDGNPAVILNVPAIFSGAEMAGTTSFKQALALDQAPRSKGCILVVDDSITTRTLEKHILTVHGYQVEEAVCGEDALAKADSRRFNLVITDIQMPGIDGFELTRQLRSRETYRDIPVIVVSSLVRDEDKRNALLAGAQAYITKGSFSEGGLLDTVDSLIG